MASTPPTYARSARMGATMHAACDDVGYGGGSSDVPCPIRPGYDDGHAPPPHTVMESIQSYAPGNRVRVSGGRHITSSTVREVARAIYRLALPLWPGNLPRVLWDYALFFRDWRRYRRMPGAEPIGWIDLYPRLGERCATTPVDLNYFLQDTWAARKIFETRPAYHVDIGSTALFVGIISQFTRVCSIDIRPLPVELPGLEVRTGSILNLPFADQTLPSISSLCVIEHVGLGRYGDPLDPQGTVRAAQELQRVLAPNGNLYVSVPVSKQRRTFFHAHRSFRHEDVITMFSALTLQEAVFIQWGKRFTIDQWDKIPFGEKEVVGLYHFSRS